MNTVSTRLNIFKTYNTTKAGMYLINLYTELLNNEATANIIDIMEMFRIVKCKATIAIIDQKGEITQSFEQE